MRLHQWCAIACLSGPECKFNYFAGAGAGVADVAAVAATPLFAFLCFFTCFFTVGVELSVGAAAACAANDIPAVANVRESPSNTAEIFFMVLSDSFVEALFCLPLYLWTKPLLTGPEQPVK